MVCKEGQGRGIECLCRAGLRQQHGEVGLHRARFGSTLSLELARTQPRSEPARHQCRDDQDQERRDIADPVDLQGIARLQQEEIVAEGRKGRARHPGREPGPA